MTVQEKTPSHRVDDTLLNSLPPDFLLGFYEPFALGEKLGEKWVESVDLDEVCVAAMRRTTSEQIEEYFEFYRDRIAEGSCPHSGNIYIADPLNPEGDTDSEIINFFRQKRSQYFYFQGNAAPSDSQVCSGDGFFLSEVPNRRFRDFEAGWTCAVRRYLESLLLSHRELWS